MTKFVLLVSTWLLLQNVAAHTQAPVNIAPLTLHNASSTTPQKAREVGLYPNPSTGKVILSLSGFKEKALEVQVINVIGNVVLRENFYETQEQATHELDLSKFTKGLYYVKLKAEKYNAIRRVVLH